jgi:hypothetical protein
LPVKFIGEPAQTLWFAEHETTGKVLIVILVVTVLIQPAAFDAVSVYMPEFKVLIFEMVGLWIELVKPETPAQVYEFAEEPFKIKLPPTQSGVLFEILGVIEGTTVSVVLTAPQLFE